MLHRRLARPATATSLPASTRTSGSNHKTFVRVGRASSNASTPTINVAFPQAGGNGDPGIFLNTAWTGVVSDTWTIHPNLVGEFRGNFDRTLNQTQMYSQGFDTGSLGFPGSFVSRIESPIFPAFTITDESPLGPTSSSDFTDAEGSYEGQAHFTWARRSHTVKTGFDYLFVYFNEFRPTWPAGNFTFSRGLRAGSKPERGLNRCRMGLRIHAPRSTRRRPDHQGSIAGRVAEEHRRLCQG